MGWAPPDRDQWSVILPCEPSPDTTVNLISYLSELAQLLLLQSDERDRIVKRPTKYLAHVRKRGGTSRLSNVTNYNTVSKV